MLQDQSEFSLANFGWKVFCFLVFFLSGIALTTKLKPDFSKNLNYFQHINNS